MFRISVETTDHASHNFDDQPPAAAVECVSMYATQAGDGLRFLTADGACFWPWDQIVAVRVARQPEKG